MGGSLWWDSLALSFVLPSVVLLLGSFWNFSKFRECHLMAAYVLSGSFCVVLWGHSMLS